MAHCSVLVVEDDAIIARDIALTIEELGYSVLGYARTGDEALRKARESSPDLVLLDITLAGTMRGTEVARALKNDVGCPVVFLSGSTDPATVREAAATKPLGYVPKPFTAQSLGCALEVACARLQRQPALRENEPSLGASLDATSHSLLGSTTDDDDPLRPRAADDLTGRAEEATRTPADNAYTKLHGATPTGTRPSLGRSAVLNRAASPTDPRPLAEKGSSIALADAIARALSVQVELPHLSIANRQRSEETEQNRLIVAERDLLAATLQTRTRQLEEALEELRVLHAQAAFFDGALAHELRARIHVILGYTDILADSSERRLTEAERAAVDEVRVAISRMKDLTNSLLRLSWAGNHALERTHVDVSAVARSILDELQRQSPSRVLEMQIDDAIHVYADAALTRVVVDNVLRNAWNFTARRTVSKISVRRGLVDGVWSVVVTDNGIGLPQSDTEKLFSPLFRLPNARGFDGQGLGLSTVHRIVDRHGGRVALAGVVGIGAQISFDFGEDAS